MPYRGTTGYHLAYGELIQAARFRGLTTYTRIATIAGLPTVGNAMGAAVGNLLGEIVEQERSEGREGMLSAVCVSAQGRPSEGFYALAQTLGLFPGGDPAAKKRFWEQQLEKVYADWKP